MVYLIQLIPFKIFMKYSHSCLQGYRCFFFLLLPFFSLISIVKQNNGISILKNISLKQKIGISIGKGCNFCHYPFIIVLEDIGEALVVLLEAFHAVQNAILHLLQQKQRRSEEKLRHFIEFHHLQYHFQAAFSQQLQTTLAIKLVLEYHVHADIRAYLFHDFELLLHFALRKFTFQRRSIVESGLQPKLLQFGKLKHGVIVESPSTYIVIQSFHDGVLSFNEFGYGQLSMAYLLVYSFDLQRIDFVHLTGYMESHHTDFMQFGSSQALFFLLEVSVHEEGAIEVRMVVKFVSRGHLNHPIQHLRPQMSIYFVIQEKVSQRLFILSFIQDTTAIFLQKLTINRFVLHVFPLEGILSLLMMSHERLLNYMLMVRIQFMLLVAKVVSY